MPGGEYDLLDYKLDKWLGYGLSKNATGHQFVEGEYMKADEYDAFIEDPSDFLMRIYMPRVFGPFEPYKMLQPLINILELPSIYFMSYSNPEVQKALQTLISIGEELSIWMRAIDEFNKRWIEQGFPIMGRGIFAKAPFDSLGDTLRGTQGLMMDIYRQPDNVLKAMDIIANMTIKSVITSANR